MLYIIYAISKHTSTDKSPKFAHRSSFRWAGCSKLNNVFLGHKSIDLKNGVDPLTTV